MEYRIRDILEQTFMMRWAISTSIIWRLDAMSMFSSCVALSGYQFLLLALLMTCMRRELIQESWNVHLAGLPRCVADTSRSTSETQTFVTFATNVQASRFVYTRGKRQRQRQRVLLSLSRCVAAIAFPPHYEVLCAIGRSLASTSTRVHSDCYI